MKVLVVGSGGREHALAWRLSASPLVAGLHAAPGNPGVATLAECHPVHADDVAGLVRLATRIGIDLAVVGPEAPLVAGLADELRTAGVAVFGPGRGAARIEGSKAFAKDVMAAAGVPTARELEAPRAPCVIKADGLAAGKGVFVCTSQREAEDGIERARAFGGGVVVEELLEGEEVSVFALCDGRTAVALPPAQDYKRIGDGDTGPNTGGMGSFSPARVLGDGDVDDVLDQVHRPVLAELARRGTPFSGLLYAGMMLTSDGPRVLEFNCRFGDPETQSILPRLRGDLAELLAAAAAGDLAGVSVGVRPLAAVTVVLAASGYPDAPETGVPISGLDEAAATGALVFHAGTALADGRLVSAGGRVLDVTGSGETVAAARSAAYAAIERIEFPRCRWRRDIALDAVETGAGGPAAAPASARAAALRGER